MHPKDAAGIANSLDPVQTAPVCPNLSVRKLRNIKVYIDVNSQKCPKMETISQIHPLWTDSRSFQKWACIFTIFHAVVLLDSSNW